MENMNGLKHSITGVTFSEKIIIEIEEERNDSIEKLKNDAQTLHHIFKDNLPVQTYHELEKLFLLEIIKEHEENK